MPPRWTSSAPRGSVELRRIRWIRDLEGPSPGPPLSLGIGDDAAIWRPAPGSAAVLTVDTQVEGVHFRKDWLTPREIGSRAVAASLSDLAAMAARPACILASLVLDPRFPEADFRHLYRGIRAAALRHGAPVAGGNLSSGPFSVTITAVGEGDPRRLLRRSGARPGDEIWVTGTPGLARLGLARLEASRARRRPAERGAAAASLRAFLAPRPRIAEALHIASVWRPGAMIDLSDGLASDLQRLLEASSAALGQRLGAEIEEVLFLGMTPLVHAARALGVEPVAAALAGGEDYELLFTARPRRDADLLAARFRKAFRLPIVRVGHVLPRPGIRLRTAGGASRAVSEQAWQHW
jgi:thiamine-monophosphate kinase